jgi:heptaprenyl diphosphate synthase
MNNKTKQIAKYGLLTSLALILGYVESLIPAFFAIPGMKLGLPNIAVIIALYIIGVKGAFIINISRILLISFLFGNGISLLFSLSGGLLSLIIMIILKSTKKIGIIPVSICGAVSHNAGQIIVAMLLLETTSVAWYLAVLWFAGLAAGVVIGIISGEVIKRINAKM